MKIRSYAKINLFLNVVGQREDGYHYIESVIQRVDLYDDIYINIDKNFDGIEIEIECDKEYVPIDEKNLCYKSSIWFMKKYNLKGKVFINIMKNIPVSAGLAGGTSNGAVIIKALNKMYDLNLDIEILAKESVVLGADFPYCIMGGTILCEGIGEKLTKVNSFGNNIIVLVKPDFGLSAKQVYSNFNSQNVKYNVDKFEFLDFLKEEKFYDLCKSLGNVLEYADIEEIKIIRNIKNQLLEYGAINSLMSGSGSTVYGIFDNLYNAQKCYDKLKKLYDEVFLTRTIDV